MYHKSFKLIVYFHFISNKYLKEHILIDSLHQLILILELNFKEHIHIISIKLFDEGSLFNSNHSSGDSFKCISLRGQLESYKDSRSINCHKKSGEVPHKPIDSGRSKRVWQ